MNSQLTYQVAQTKQQDLHRAGERAREARAISGPSRFRAFCGRLLSGGPVPQGTRSPDPLLRAKLGI